MNLNDNFNQKEFTEWVENFLPEFNLDIRKVDVPQSFSDVLTISTLGESSIGVRVYIIETDADPSKRKVGLATDSFSLLKNYASPNAIIAYYSKDSSLWRISLLTSTPIWSEGKIITKLSNPKRQSYVLGKNAKVKTPYQYLLSKGKVSDFNDLKTRFSLEVVNKEFYKEISLAFTKLVGGTVTSGRSKKLYEAQLKLPYIKNHSQTSLEFSVRLIGRIIFCWFLREKRSNAGHSLMPKELLSYDATKTIEDYYQKILEPIFFEILNKPVNSRKPNFINELFSAIPYLNGGLFSPHDDDFFNYNEGKQAINHNLVVIPDKWLQSFFEVLETYNFTIDENTSFDEELSIDPEMLGRIFENLLAEINPETGESARKSTGSYYTPRVIVDYMIDESLFLYLKGETNIEEVKLRSLISHDLDDDISNPLTNDQKTKITEALGKIKILDPACGSGAFPIGALQKIVFILQQIDQTGQLWFKKQIENTPIELRKIIEREFKEKNFDYIRKLGIIRENIYGVDIQPIATEISRLRCFLTLVVDERIDDSLENRGIEPLPNLDFKFVTANTLVGLPTSKSTGAIIQVGLFEDNEGINELKEVRDMFFTASGFERDQLKLQFSQTQNKMLHKLIDESRRGHADMTSKLTSWDPFSHKASSWFDPEWMFGIKKGFDMVIANPPYVFTRKMDFTDEFKKYVKENYLSRIRTSQLKSRSKQSGKINLFGLFIIKAIDLLVEDGKMTYILPNTLLRTTTYDLIRKFILDNTQVNQIVDLGGGIFEGVTASTIVIQLTKVKEKNTNNVEIISKIIDLPNKQFSKSIIRQDKYLKNISYSFTTHSDNKIESLLNKIEADHNKLGNYCIDIIEGIVAHKYLIHDANDTDLQPLIEGKDVGRFFVKNPRNWIEWESKKIHRKRPEYLWKTPVKILIQRISGGSNPIVAALDNKQFKTFASVNNLVLKDDYKQAYNYVLGILNSKLINYYYANKFSNNSTLTVNISKTFLEALPIDINNNQLEIKISEIVSKIIEYSINDQGSDDYKKLNLKLNSLVYELYKMDKSDIEKIELNYG